MTELKIIIVSILGLIMLLAYCALIKASEEAERERRKRNDRKQIS